MSAKRTSPQRGNARAILGLALLCFLASARTWCAVEHSTLELLPSDGLEKIPAESLLKSIFFQLPEHVLVEANSELKLVLLSSSPELNANLFTITVSLNGTMLLTRPAGTAAGDKIAGDRVELVAQLGDAAIRGWNRIDLRFAAANGVTNDSAKLTWLLDKSDCKVSLAYSRLPMFPELGRFPASLAEEKLLQSMNNSNAIAQPLVTFVLPKVLRDVHLRAITVLAARFGQLGYFSDQDYGLALADLSSWRPGNGNSIVVGTSEDVGQARLLTNIANLSKPLQPAQGLVAEAIIGSDEVPHRCLLVSGADDAGLEKALLLLANSKAVATIGPSPAIVTDPPPLPNVAPDSESSKIDGLNLASQFLQPDPLLQHLAFVLPLDASADALRLLGDLALFCGRRFATSPALWPEACGYEINRPPPATRLQGKSVILFGLAKQWKSALPAGTALAVEVPDPMENNVRIQGRFYRITEFEPSLLFLQLTPSPWSRGDLTLVAGGWETFASPKMKWSLIDAEAPAKIYGNVAAIDAQGRIVCYDTRRAASDSLQERLAKFIPPNVSFEETERLLRQTDAQNRQSRQVNWVVFYAFGGLLLFLILTRLILLWDRSRTREKAMRTEKPLHAS